MNQTVEPYTDSLQLSGLEKFTNYSIQMQAFVWCRDGPPSGSLIVTTDEDSKFGNRPDHVIGFSDLVDLWVI